MSYIKFYTVIETMKAFSSMYMQLTNIVEVQLFVSGTPVLSRISAVGPSHIILRLIVIAPALRTAVVESSTKKPRKGRSPNLSIQEVKELIAAERKVFIQWK